MLFDSPGASPAAPAARSNAPRASLRSLHAVALQPADASRIIPAAIFGIAGLLLLLVLWLAVTAPLSASLRAPVPPSLTLLSAEGRPIARQGAIVDDPVDVVALPRHVWLPVLAIEDRRYYLHWGVDPLGLVRAAWVNLLAGEIREGGSTITQQLAKQAFLDPQRSFGRKLREFLIAFWLELRLDKDEILSRYLSTAYFGNNVYGLRAASYYYFDRPPERLTTPQAAMLAGLMKAPSRLNPTDNLGAAQARARTVLAAMVEARLLDEPEASRMSPALPVPNAVQEVPSGTYFADWVFPAARERAERTGTRAVRTTLEQQLQRLAVRTVSQQRLRGAQVALVAMRPDGSVAAMVGGRSYRESPFNRVTQARRQPGSAFKLFVYLAALRAGITPDFPVDDWPLTVGSWSPVNADGRYRGFISVREAFAVSSNVAAVRLAQQVGVDEVVRAARELGVRSELDPQPSLALGTSTMTLLELASAYAAVAAGAYPVTATGLASDERAPGSRFVRRQRFDEQTTWPMLLDLLWSSANVGTGRAAAMDVPTFGKTGTSQDSRDALFVGFVGDLVVAIWVGHDDNRPLGGVAGGGLPARIWRDFMSGALRSGAVRLGQRSPFVVPRIAADPFAMPDQPSRGTRDRRRAEDWDRDRDEHWDRRRDDDRWRDWEREVREREREWEEWERARERWQRDRERWERARDRDRD